MGLGDNDGDDDLGKLLDDSDSLEFALLFPLSISRSWLEGTGLVGKVSCIFYSIDRIIYPAKPTGL